MKIDILPELIIKVSEKLRVSQTESKEIIQFIQKEKLVMIGANLPNTIGEDNILTCNDGFKYRIIRHKEVTRKNTLVGGGKTYTIPERCTISVTPMKKAKDKLSV